jgi:acyl-CoA thioester hydrolase
VALDEFSFVRHFAVEYSEIDMMRHANNLAYLRWAEEQRAGYLSEVLGENPFGGRSIILLKIDCTYEAQLVYHEAVACATRISRIGRKSFDFCFEIWSETQSRRVAHGLAVMVAYDYDTHASIEVPGEWRARVATFERLAPA